MADRPANGDDAFFLDTNVVMYAAGADHPLREPCRAALRAAVEARVPLVTDAEVLQEILHRYFAIRRPDMAATVYRSAVDLCDEVLPITEKEADRALALLGTHAGISARDAIHAASMESAGLRRLLSADSHFDVIPSVHRTDPTAFEPGHRGAASAVDER